MTARTPQRQQLIELISPVITAAGYDLDDLSVTAAGRRSLIRVSVDGDHGIDLDAVATISRTISEVLDDDSGSGASFAGPYVLEVSSPGVDRPLTQPRHWRRATGRLVTVDVDGQPLTGRVVTADDSAVVLEVAGARRSLPTAGLGPGRVQVEFSRPGEPELDDDDADFDGDDLDHQQNDEEEA
ncbi:MAG TPA: ribosome maturation factor RimP [Jatrophihabitans sp.]|jgi:ribosome maturation factor RimP|uniref:ribosome maturation factor RimP n=1 Tax=Jatrophihabitans sp. TaxID=1932789 RepID=UPI002EE6F172